jgi:C1A family cysteine protease
MSNRIYNYVFKEKPVSVYTYNYKSVTSPAYHLISTKCPILDQGQLGSCVSSASYATFYIMSNGKFQLSRLQLYFCARAYEKLSLTKDTGLNILGALQTVKSYGISSETYWPYIIANFAKLAPSESFTQLYTLNNYSYASVIQDIAHIKECLVLNLPVIIGVKVYDSFESNNASKTGIIPTPSSNENLLGGHCIILVGYNDDVGYFQFQNSWGTNWGDKGYGYLPYNYVTDTNLTSDLYVVHFAPPV